MKTTLPTFKIVKLLIFFLTISVSGISQTKFVTPPFIQMGTATSFQVNYNTNTQHKGIIKIGTIPNNFFITYNETESTKEHKIKVDNLLPDTRYFYAVYVGDTLLKCGIDYFYKTSQPIGSTEKLNVWVTGDCGTGSKNQLDVAAQMEKYLNGEYINAWLLLGDNAYTDGQFEEFQKYFFKPYQESKFIKQTSIYPSPGNHDYGYDLSAPDHRNIPYFKFFSMPANGEIGGEPSGGPQFYSYNIHNVHFVSLDSYGRDSYVKFWDTLVSPQVKWLKKDLAANKQPWTVIYFHHPPFTMGTHNSDRELDLVAIRQNLVPIFEKYKVDLVLCGHSHTYERSKPMSGHYGLEGTFQSALYNKSTSTARYDGSPDSCPYIQLKGSDNHGVVYAVAGSAGFQPRGQQNFPHKAMPIGNITNSGSLLLTFEGDKMDAKFVTDKGNVDDKFTIFKTTKLPRDTTLLLADSTKLITLKASPKPNYVWPSNRSTLSQITVPVENGQVIRVADSFGCFPDIFRIAKTGSDCPKAKLQNIDFESLSKINLKASKIIKSENRVLENSIVTFSAGNAIELKPGFEVKKGAVFSTKLKGCD